MKGIPNILCFFLVLLMNVSILTAQDNPDGWQANPELVDQLEEQRPDYNWREESIPSYELPTLLEAPDGRVIQSPVEWQQRRDEILELFRKHMYGRRPGPPDDLTFDVHTVNESAMNGAATSRSIRITSEEQGRTHEFEVTLFLPNHISEPVPVFLLLNNRDPENTDPTREIISGFWPAEEVIARGYGIAAIQNSDLAPDDEEHYVDGVIRLFEGEAADAGREPDAWGALAAWGWGASRVMDYFETDVDVNASRIALIGHSRGGKASLWAGAEDRRFSLVISNESGSGGAALSRRRFGETVEAVNRFTHWFSENFKTFNEREDELPFDQHMLISLLAPRAVYVASADEDLWADPRGEFLSLVNASPAYSLWGHEPLSEDEMPQLNTPLINGPRGYHVRTGGHNLTPQDWHNFMDFTDHLWRE